MGKNPKTFYAFGPFRVDAAERQLWREGEEIALTPKAFGVLLTLVEHAGQTLSKDELMRAVWPDAVVEEGNLTDNVSTLRKALGDDKSAPRYIKTVPSRGYRFVGEVAESDDEEIDLVVTEHTRAHIVVEEQGKSEGGAGLAEGGAVVEHKPLIAGPRAAPWQTRRGLRWAAFAVACGLLGASAVAFYLFRAARREPAAGNPAQIRSIAVLPFKPLDAAGRDEALELGMADSLITRLSGIRDLVVRPTSAVRSFTDLNANPVEAGRGLQVESVLEGHIQRAGDRVRVTVRLVRVSDEEAVWTAQFDDKYTDIFAVQDSISQKVVAALGPKLSSEEEARLAKRYTQNTEAYRLYLTGRFFWNKMTADGLRESIVYYRRAVALDPSYALAHAGVADAYNMLANWDFLPDDEAFPEAEAAAHKALAIDDTLAEAHAALAYAKFRYGWEWQTAEAEFRRAIELNPNYPTAREFYAEYLIVARRFDEALVELKRAEELDPLSLYVKMQAAIRFYFMRRYDEAIGQLREVVRMDSNYSIAYGLMWACYREMGMHAESVAAQLESLRRNGYTEAELKSLRAAFDASGVEGFQRKEIELWKAHPDSLHFSSIFIAMNYALLGEKAEALAWLEKARARRHGWLTELKADPVWDSLRDEPRFARLVEQVNIPR